MEREKAFQLLKNYVKNENLIKHCLASEAVLRALAIRLGENPEKWALAGLIHDLDVEITASDIKKHTLEAEKILKENGFEDEIIEAVKMHNEAAHNLKREKVFHIALAAGETITGLIIAAALVYPDKKLASIKPSSVLKRMKDKRFAAGANREIIMECEKLGLKIDEFVEICLKAMQGVAGELGL